MSFSFNPGQGGQVPQASGSEAPPLFVPTAPVISTAAPVEVISPFAYKNRNKSKFSTYFQLVIFVIFGVVSLITMGLFTYQQILVMKIESQKEALELKEKDFPKLELDKMQRLSSRIKVINKILSERASVNTALKLLEGTTLDNNVTYTKFSLARSKKYKGFDLSFAGETTSYTFLYQQIAALNDKRFSKYFSRVDISGLGPLDSKGIGNFKADTVVTISGIDPDTFTLDPATSTPTSPVIATTTNTVPATSPANVIPTLQ